MRTGLCRLLCAMQSKLDAFFAPPASVRGIRQLDRAAFRREVTLPAVFLREPTLCSKFIRKLQHVVLKYPRIKQVQTRAGEDDKVGHSENSLFISPVRCPLSSLEVSVHTQGVANWHSF